MGPQSTKTQAQCANIFQDFSWGMFAMAPLAKGRHMANPDIWGKNMDSTSR